ncbi:extracellular solute-binding protein [Microbacterium tumbae]
MKSAAQSRHRRVMAAAALAGAASLALAGCTTGAEGGGDDGVVELTFLSHYGSDPFKTGIGELIDQWNEENPDIQVTSQAVNFDELLTTLNVRQTGGRGADIVSSYSLWGGQLQANGVLSAPPEDVAADITDNYSPAALASVTTGDGQILGYPTEFNTYALFYNKQILADAGYDAPPATWDELVEIADATTEKDGSGNTIVQGLSLIQDGDNHTVHPFLSLLDSADGEFLASDGTSAMDDSAEEVMQLEADLAETGATSTSIMPTKAFPTGGVAMAVQAGWWIGSLKASMGDDYADVGVAPIPGPEAGDVGSLAYSFFTGVNSGSQHQEEAWEFLSWLNSHENADGVTALGDFLATQGLIPPRTADAEILGPKYLAEEPNLEAIYAAADYAMAESNASNAYEAKTSTNTALNDIIVNGADVKDTFDKLVKEIDAQ